MATAIDVANFFLNYADKDEESGELISNLKIQKLVYYAQGFSLAAIGAPLFEEEIEAWTHGPVIPQLYQEFKCYGNGPITPPENFDASEVFSEDQIDLLNEVYDVYGQFSAWKLRNMTHNDTPWRNNEKYNDVIPVKEMTEYFTTLIE